MLGKFCVWAKAAKYLFVVLIALPAWPQTKNLKLLNVKRVMSWVTCEHGGSEPVGITEPILNVMLQLRLRTSGFDVISAGENYNSPGPVSHVTMDVLSGDIESISGVKTGFVFSVALSVKVYQESVFNKSFAPMVLWSKMAIVQTSRENSRTVLESAIATLVDCLANQRMIDNKRR